MIRQAFFVTGFNNWGKTSVIQELFGRRAFGYANSFQIPGVPDGPRPISEFTVETHSNDDYRGQLWNDHIINQLQISSPSENFFSAICPSIEDTNNFIDLLARAPFEDCERFYFFLIEHKWDRHAKLNVEAIRNIGRQIPYSTFITVSADRNFYESDRIVSEIAKAIKKELNLIF